MWSRKNMSQARHFQWVGRTWNIFKDKLTKYCGVN